MMTNQKTIWRQIALSTVWIILVTGKTEAVDFIRWERDAGGNGHYYGILGSPTNWTAAENTAVGMGGHLASITSAAEQAFIVSNLLVGTYDRLPLWIGLCDLVPYGGGAGSRIYTRWTSGEPVGFTYWNTGEPNNHTPGEDYAAINWHRAASQSETKGTWNDTPLNGSTLFGGFSTGPYCAIIEIDLEPRLSLGSYNATNNSFVLMWSSVTNHLYTVYFSTNLINGFSVLETNILATSPENSLPVSTGIHQQMFWKVSTMTPEK
ncbi:MAG: hypothetical protein MUC65_05515 [Pontiellaceae bacterium]|nr:hypothetical protein [Pontiellaceae bacterium]